MWPYKIIHCVVLNTLFRVWVEMFQGEKLNLDKKKKKDLVEDVFLKNFGIIHIHFISWKLVLKKIFWKNFLQKILGFKIFWFFMSRLIEPVSRPIENVLFLGKNSSSFDSWLNSSRSIKPDFKTSSIPPDQSFFFF